MKTPKTFLDLIEKVFYKDKDKILVNDSYVSLVQTENREIKDLPSTLSVYDNISAIEFHRLYDWEISGCFYFYIEFYEGDSGYQMVIIAFHTGRWARRYSIGVEKMVQYISSHELLSGNRRRARKPKDDKIHSRFEIMEIENETERNGQ